MNHSLTLEIPQPVYENLVKKGTQTGKTPEEVAVQLLSNSVQEPLAEDPLEEFIGAFNSNIPDWTEKHDQYLGKALNENIK